MPTTTWRSSFAMTSALYRFVMYTYRFALYVRWVTAPAFRMTSSTRERASIVRFALKLLVARAAIVIGRHLQNSFRQGDTSITLRGVTYYVGLRTNEIGLFGEIYHERAYDQLDAFIPKTGWTVFDVGANVGIFTIQQALRGSQVFAFEPNPDCYRRLTKAVTANGLDGRVTAFSHALGSEPGIGTVVARDGFTI